jgi:drug/metabolite transporter (DMT)-like permease
MFEFIKTPTALAGAISDATPIATILQNILNFLLSIIGVLAIIALVVAGLFYLTAAGNSKQIETAKKAFYYAVIGIIVTLGALVLVSQIGDFFAS